MQLEFYSQIFEKNTQVKFDGNPSSGSECSTRMDRHDDAVICHLSQFCERA